MRKFKFAVIGYYGFGNLGDELLLQASLNILEHSGVERERIIVLSNNPEETSKKFNIKSVSRWSLLNLIKILSSSEFLLLGGGGLFQDSTSIKSCLWYWGLVRLAKFLNSKVLALGQSLGPLNSKISKFFTRDAVKICKIFHVRDLNSLKVAEDLGIETKKIILGSDLALTLRINKNVKNINENKDSSNENLLKNNKNYYLVNLRPCKNIEDYIKIISPELKNFKENFNGEIIGAALSQEDENILNIYKKDLYLEKIILIHDFQEAQNLWLGASQAIGMRLHFGVISRIFRVPVALMPYDPKVKAFAEQSDIPCIINKFKEPELPLEIPENYFSEICKILKAL